MKKWISCILCGMILVSSSVIIGTSLKDQQKTQISTDASNDDYIPILAQVVITVSFDGTYDVELQDYHLEINNWTGQEKHSIIMRFQIHNPYHNTGSTIFFWRLAEYPDTPMAWFIFWLTHGCVRPIEPQILVSKLRINWSAADDDVTIKDYTISFINNCFEPCEICLWIMHSPRNWIWSCFYFIPMET